MKLDPKMLEALAALFREFGLMVVGVSGAIVMLYAAFFK